MAATINSLADSILPRSLFFLQESIKYASVLKWPYAVETHRPRLNGN